MLKRGKSIIIPTAIKIAGLKSLLQAAFPPTGGSIASFMGPPG